MSSLSPPQFITMLSSWLFKFTSKHAHGNQILTREYHPNQISEWMDHIVRAYLAYTGTVPTLTSQSCSQAESITFTIVQPPRHGAIERAARGQHFHLTSSFTMEDIYQNRVSYSHDGSNSLKDRFTFTVSDGTNPFFMIEEGGKE
ncbi:extracellular matrix protein FRAS1-like protein, partial [Cricetulus griseus]